jgi:predicted lipoprotein
VCKSCEKINQRYKYLNKKPNRLSSDETEIQLIQELYNVQRTQGLKPPGTVETEPIDIVAAIARQQAQAIKAPVQVDSTKADGIPHDLQHWLTLDLQAFKPDDLEQVSDELIAKYRKPIGVNQVTMEPIYDEQYRDALKEVIKRFDDYEEHYYADKE